MPIIANEKSATLQEFLDKKQYSKAGILRYERVFGEDFISTGGLDTTEEVVKLLNLKPGMRVLDVGCGIGGSAFYMALKYGVIVHGIDLSQNCLEIANDKLEMKYPQLKDQVKFTMEDVNELEFADGSFDVVYTRDALIHIKEKAALFAKFQRWLKPSGRVLITDYCRGDIENFSQEFEEYVLERGYHLPRVSEYGRLLENLFPRVLKDDRTERFVAVLRKELDIFAENKEAFVKDFSEDDYEWIREGWEAKIQRSFAKEQTWALFLATKADA